jgi:hypothetical protein
MAYMQLDLCMPSFVDELEKIAQTYGLGSFQQTRVGRRPIRVHNMLRKDMPTQDKPDSAEERYKPPERGVEYEGGSGMTEAVGNYMGGA